MVNPNCQDYRDRCLELRLRSSAVEPLPGHAASCADCAAWFEARRAQLNLLESLVSLRPPLELDRALSDELTATGEPQPARCEALIRGLAPLPAPDELEQRVRALLERPGEADQGARDPRRLEGALRSLGGESVSSVLERLVAEELGSPAAHRVDRFVGNLPIQGAPPELTARVAADLAGDASASGLAQVDEAPQARARAASWSVRLGALAAAASLVFWLTLVNRSAPTPGRSAEGGDLRRLRVVRVDGPGQLSPLAQGLATSLNGGWSGEGNG